MNNLGKFLHPRKSEMPGESDPAAGSKMDAAFAGKSDTAAAPEGPVRDIPEPRKPAAPRTKTNTPPSAEERFYKSAGAPHLTGRR
jgi:hypothetical protein